MATTKRARCRFRVSEFSPEVREGAEPGTLRIAPVPFISTECQDVGAQDVFDGGLLGFDLQDGVSMEEAEEIADFLNAHIQSLAVTRFGDIDDARRDVRQSHHVQGIERERFAAVLLDLRERVASGDANAAAVAMKGVESVASDLFSGWSEAIARSQAILDAFGRGEDPDA